jgi:hypothetical protein
VVRAWGLALLTASSAWAAPLLSGTYHGDLGVVQFDTQDGRVSAHYERAGSCSFDPDRRLIEGAFEGDVLVGTVTLCQVGTSCTEHVYPFLAFYNPHDGTLTADVKLEPGCQSPALNKQRLLLEKGEGTTAVESAPRKRGPKYSEEQGKRHFDAANKAMVAGDFPKAKTEAELGLSFAEQNAGGYFTLGVAEISMNHVQAALEAYRRSGELNPGFPDTFYNAACAYARMSNRKEALANLERAVKLGFSDPDTMAADQDLGKLLSNDPEFQQLLHKAKERQQQQQHHPHGTRRDGSR